jgi:hypothetical protein
MRTLHVCACLLKKWVILSEGLDIYVTTQP